MSDITTQAKQLQEKITAVAEQLNLSGMQEQLAGLEVKMSQPDFWNNQDQAQTVSKQANELQAELDTWKTLNSDVQDVIEMADLNAAEPDAEITADLQNQLAAIQTSFEAVEFQILLGDEYDTYPVLLAIHAGAGGADAQDWAEMLLRMVTRYAERKQYTVKTVDLSRGSEAGIKSAVLEISGRYAYGYLKSEHGVHRLVRQSPFNSDALRQTSFALMEVLPDLGEASPIELNDEDLRIDVFRSGGNGGQSVNTTDSAVRIVHEPTGITVTCQNEKSQHQNKAAALKILKARLHQRELEEQAKERQQLRGEYTSAEWGNQIRSYVLHPYKMVKDHRTEYEESDPEAVLDGKLEGYIEAYLRSQVASGS